MATTEELLQAVDDVISDGARRGMLHVTATDERLDGRLITVDGQSLVNFGSCSYLGLETHPALRAGVIDAVERFGTQFSSSRAYVSAPAYPAAEQALTELFGRPTVITSSTTLGHISAMPTVIGAQDALLLDHQVHHSVQIAAKLAQAQGTAVELLPHVDMEALDKRVTELGRTHRRIWYATDGLYSMYADFVPVDALNELAERHERLWFYVDDAHALSWTGRFGRGHVLERLNPTAAGRAVVAGSLNKSFAASGGALTFPDEEMRRRVFTVGGPLVFSGPVQPPMLGAITASARLHRSEEVRQLQERLRATIRLFNRLTIERGLPLVSHSEAPIRCVGAGVPEVAYNLTGRLREAGFFVDTATFPAVAAKRSGARVALTARHTHEDVEALVEALARSLPAALADEGSSIAVLERSFARQLAGRRVRLEPVATSPELIARRSEQRLELHHTIDSIDPREWDTMFAGRGAFDWHGMRTLESAFAGTQDRPENSWDFDYWIVRDPNYRPVAASVFTTALWKDDFLSSPELSAQVETRRVDDPYYLTSRVVGMGTLLTVGDHLYVDRTADWPSAVRLILGGAREAEDRQNAAMVALRDLPDSDEPLHDLLIGEGFVRLPVPSTWTRTVDFVDDEEFLAGLSKKARYHQRVNVLAWEHQYDVRVITSGTTEAASLSEAERAHLYALYRGVHRRNLTINVFPLSRRVLDQMLAHPGWELITLRVEGGPERPVAFVLQHIGPDHVHPIFVGHDYAYVASHHAYQQTLWQSIRSAQRHGARRVLLGMGAELQKARFGAVPERRWVYAQSSESFNLDVLTRLAQGMSLAG